MHPTLFYNYLVLNTPECEEDLKILFTFEEGILNKVTSEGEHSVGNPVYKLYVGSSYVLGPHIIKNALGELVRIKTCYNIYKVVKMLPTSPIFIKFGNVNNLCELIEVEVIRSNDRLLYYDFLYGDK